MEILVLTGIVLLLVFGARRGGREPGTVGKTAGVALVVWLALVGGIALAWRALIGDGACPMGQCTGSTKAPPATAATTLDGRWMGLAGDAPYVLNLAQSGTSVTGTGTREGDSLAVGGWASPDGVRLDLGGAAFRGAFSDARTVRGRIQDAAGGEHELVLRKRSR